jgi:hypothetical protein
MMALIRTRKATILFRLVIVLALTALTSSAAGDRDTTDLSEDGRTCFVIDGQIYCIPETGSNGSLLQPGLPLQ